MSENHSIEENAGSDSDSNSVVFDDYQPISASESDADSEKQEDNGDLSPDTIRMIDAMEKVANGINKMATAIESLSNHIPIAELRAAVKEVDGYEPELLMRVLEYLNRHTKEAQLFMFYEVEERKIYINRKMARF
ncbi:uncharacterized protein LOC143849077 isoform X2 [Tasmannia lanceolata]|uniref:uncharacterized protein LOC143849077 isoform X2 n=1 Tax=Tasmannia lanceolata TaxID=3420 RepID=UPI0040637AD4